MDEPVRVLHVVVNMNRGGAETLLMNLYRNMNREKIQFDFLTCKPGAFDKEIEELGGKVHRIPYVTEKGHFGYIRALDEFFYNHPEYIIVHSHLDKMSGFVLKSAWKQKIPYRIAHSHNTNSEGNVLAKLYKWYAGQHILPKATHYVACSSAAAKWLFQRKESEAIILKNGVDSNQFAFSLENRISVREEWGFNDKHLIFGHVGRLHEQKNHLFLIDTFAEVVKKNNSARLVLVGDGPLRLQIEERIKDLKIEDKVLMLGIRSDIDKILQGFDMFVFPSLHEGLPVTLIEAQGAGLPCLISDNITNEVDVGLGLIQQLPLQDKRTWVSAMVEHQVDTNKRYRLENALSNSDYDIKKAAIWTENFYLVM
ncbi:MAG: glycosyltransferase family 1 protein [Bacillaceae bacterium]|nr:glycosyltransferase family 1 protein [Bacillaceae bacterium]